MYTQRVTVFRDVPQVAVTVLLEPDEEKPVEPVVTPPPLPAPAPAPQTFVAKFDVSEPGIENRVDGRSIGKSPGASVAALNAGHSHHFLARGAEYQDAEGDFSSGGHTEVTVPIALESIATATTHGNTHRSSKKKRGKLVCSSNPSGADVFVDGKPAGRQTPISDTDPLELPVGTHEVQFRLAGMESAPQTVEIQDGHATIIENAAIDREHELF